MEALTSLPGRRLIGRKPLQLLVAAALASGCAAAEGPGGSAGAESPEPTKAVVSASSGASAAASSAGTSAAAPIAQLGGRWRVVASNPRVVTATGEAVGGTVSIDGSRYTFRKGDLAGNGPIDFVGDLSVDCTATRCQIKGGGLPYEIRAEGGELVLVSFVTLQRYGSGQPCALPDLPGGGVVSVTRQAMVGGAEVPSEVQLTGGHSSGVGTSCSTASYQLAWDLVGTRQP